MDGIKAGEEATMTGCRMIDGSHRVVTQCWLDAVQQMGAQDSRGDSDNRSFVMHRRCAVGVYSEPVKGLRLLPGLSSDVTKLTAFGGYDPPCL